ncbi:MAG: hypothetical protein Q7T33_10755, partial [Dehalococcoidia bacterium]|nr:hypothetical protein [Dehalococcoidia bacterium]
SELTAGFFVKTTADADVDDTLTIDRWFLAKAATAPQTAWTSSREVRNANEQPEGAGFENRVNWLDFLEVPGDVPALTKIYGQLESAVSTVLGLGVRSGENRRADALWFEGEDFASITGPIVDATASAGNYGARTMTGGGSIDLYGTVNLSTLASKGGLFAVWARCKLNAATPKIGLGWSFGGVTVAPVAADMVTITAAFTLVQVGTLTVPPAAVPSDELAASALLLRLYGSETSGAGPTLDVDYVLLLPVDEAAVLVRKASAANWLLFDGKGEQPGVYIMNASGEVTGLPTDWSGRSPLASPLGSRFHFVSDAAINTTLPIRAVITPRYLTVG